VLLGDILEENHLNDLITDLSDYLCVHVGGI
jgi:hypothetical protein